MGHELLLARQDVFQFVQVGADTRIADQIGELLAAEGEHQAGGMDDVGHKQADHVEALFLLQGGKNVLQPVAALVKFLETDHLDLPDAETQTAGGKFLEVGQDQVTAAGEPGQGTAGLEHAAAELDPVVAAQAAEPVGGLPVDVGGGGGFEQHGVRHQPGKHQGGVGRLGFDAGLAVEAGHHGAGAADRLVDEPDRLVGVKVSEPVVVDHFENVDLVGTGDRLPQFVVVDQDQPNR